MQIPICIPHAGCQKERVPENAESRVFPMDLVLFSHKLCLVGSQNPVGEHAVRQVGKIASPGRKARHTCKHRARACAQARCPLTKIKFQVFNFEILSFQSSSFNFQFSKVRRFKTKFQNGNIQISIPTTNTCIYSHKLCFVGSQNPVGEHAVRQVGKIASPGRNGSQVLKHRAQACAQARCPSVCSSTVLTD